MDPSVSLDRAHFIVARLGHLSSHPKQNGGSEWSKFIKDADSA
jgi:hypothetical protein